MIRPIVILESPCAPIEFDGKKYSRQDNYLYLQRCIRDSIMRGEAPFASHQMYTGALNDNVQIERELGISLAEPFLRRAEGVVVYRDHGVSAGMIAGIEAAHRMGKSDFKIIHRWLMREGEQLDLADLATSFPLETYLKLHEG